MIETFAKWFFGPDIWLGGIITFSIYFFFLPAMIFVLIYGDREIK